MVKNRELVLEMIFKYIFLFIGTVLVAIGLEIFLIPNHIIDGGVVGISIILNYTTKLPLGLFIMVLNLPFLIIGYKQIGKTFVISTLFAITSLSILVSIFRPMPKITNDLFLACIFGGIILGVGVGLIIKNGGSLDGTEIVAIILDKKISFSVGEIVMFFNIFILSSAGFVFGWDKAMYSLITYFIAFKMIDTVIEGFNESKAIFVVSNKSDIISKKIMARLGRGVTFIKGKGCFSGEERNIIYVVITRLEIAKLKVIIEEIDEEAFVSITNVNGVMGRNFRKKSIH